MRAGDSRLQFWDMTNMCVTLNRKGLCKASALGYIGSMTVGTLCAGLLDRRGYRLGAPPIPVYLSLAARASAWVLGPWGHLGATMGLPSPVASVVRCTDQGRPATGVFWGEGRGGHPTPRPHCGQGARCRKASINRLHRVGATIWGPRPENHGA